MAMGSLLLLPRVLLYLFMMALFSLVLLPLCTLRALYRRCFVGKATSTNATENHITGPAIAYACQIVLSAPIDDPELFTSTIVELAQECHIDSKYVRVQYEQDKPYGDFPSENSISADHYVEKGRSFVETADVMGANVSKNLAVLIRVWNNEVGKPTVLHCGLPGAHWDGTSCFNFTKEMMHRYSNPTLKKNHIYKSGQLTLKKTVQASLDQSSFLYYLLVQSPYAILYNTHAMCWRLATVPQCLGGPGLHPHVQLLNLNEQQSEEITQAAKKLNVKPFVAFVHSAVTAHNHVMEERARRVVMQASMQTRGYEPLIKERNVIGDWLVGTLLLQLLQLLLLLLLLLQLLQLLQLFQLLQLLQLLHLIDVEYPVGVFTCWMAY